MTKIYTYHNANYSLGEHKDFISFEKQTMEQADEAIVLFQRPPKTKYHLWSITKGISLADFKMPTK